MDLLTKIKDHSATVEVIGLGYVGLPPRHPICKDGIQRGFRPDPNQCQPQKLPARRNAAGMRIPDLEASLRNYQHGNLDEGPPH